MSRKQSSLATAILLALMSCASAFTADDETTISVNMIRPPNRDTAEMIRAAAVLQEDLAIIVNKANPIDNLSLAQLRGVFLAERGHWPNGQKITVVMRDQGHPEREVILRAVCRMNESDFTRHVMHSTFTGQLQSGPRLLSTAVGVRKFVFNATGAIGYLRAAEVDGSVKLLRVDGRKAGEPGYALKLAAR